MLRDAEQSRCVHAADPSIGEASAEAVDVLRRVIPGLLLQREIGRGGMGVVYEASEVATGRLVAAKLLHQDRRTPELVRRLQREAMALSRLAHPGIARLYRAGECDPPLAGSPYIVMELVEGVDPIAYSEREGLDHRQRAELLQRIADAVASAHRAGVLHLDLKPSNVLVSDDGSIKLLDFGIAKIVDGVNGPEHLTIATHAFGSLSSMSPELILEGRSGPAADVYSLGVLLYRLLSGRQPFEIEGLPLAQAARIQAACEATPCRRINPRIPKDLDMIVRVAMAREPGDRYPNAGALADDLSRYLEGQAILARPVGPIGQGVRLVRRYPRVSGGIAASLVLLTTLAVLATAFGLSANRSARTAAVSEQRATQRFNDIRELAGSVIFDLHDAVRDLPGSTQARATVLEQAERYLDRISTDPDADVETRVLLADGMRRLARARGGAEGPGAGDDERARELGHEAVAILESLFESEPDNPRIRLALAQALADLQALYANEDVVRPDAPDRFEPYHRVLRLAESVLAVDPKNTEAALLIAVTSRRIAITHLTEGDLESGLVWCAQAIYRHEAILRDEPLHIDAVLEAVTTRHALFQSLFKHDAVEAVEILEAADSTLRGLEEAEPWNTKVRAARATLNTQLSRVAVLNRDYVHARDLLREARAIRELSFEIDPNDFDSHRGITVADYWLAEALIAQAEDVQEPLASRTEAAELAVATAHRCHEGVQDRIRRGWLRYWESDYPERTEAQIQRSERIRGALRSETE